MAKKKKKKRTGVSNQKKQGRKIQVVFWYFEPPRIKLETVVEDEGGDDVAAGTKENKSWRMRSLRH